MPCPNKNESGSCKMHNLHCGWPTCETFQIKEVKPTPPPAIIIKGMHFTESEILEWREKEVAYRDRHPDDVAIDVFAQAMKNKMAQKREQGYSGWDIVDECTDEFLAKMLVDHVVKGDPVDVANFAMMLFARNVPNLTLSTAMRDAYLAYHEVLEQAKRKVKDAMGLVELPRILVDIYMDIQQNPTRYTADRRKSIEQRLAALIEIPDEPLDGKQVSNEF